MDKNSLKQKLREMLSKKGNDQELIQSNSTSHTWSQKGKKHTHTNDKLRAGLVETKRELNSNSSVTNKENTELNEMKLIICLRKYEVRI